MTYIEVSKLLVQYFSQKSNVARVRAATIIFYTFETLVNYFHLYNLVTNDEWSHSQIHVAFSCSLWLILLKVELFTIATVCSSIQATGNSIGTILHRIWIRYHPTQLKNEIQMFSLQLLQRPLRISAFGFFSLDYSYLYKIFSAVVAYFVIMVQLDTSKARSISTPNSTEWNGTDMN
ncbi:gustatory receptor 68a-like [Neodiprion fabricii]|uniref:gustatory receptor 68a-like n=1 Tax=Neodiprion fabricii TaxID=2872261 RepID=UPI001ED945A6|nr:gustatory receptor 68a-like [Neodiprion fabricii]